jgi:DNA-binding NtrC family response regulator
VFECLPARAAKTHAILQNLGYAFRHIDSVEAISNLDLYPKIAILDSVSIPNLPNFQDTLNAASRLNEKFNKCHKIFIINSTVSLEFCSHAMDLGASGFINSDEPDFIELLAEQIERVCKQIQKEETKTEYSIPTPMLDQTGIATQSQAMYKLLAQAYRAASICDAPIVIEGESGTGKQLLAEAIHKMDPKRGKNRFLSVNCSAITGTLAESELFGHKKGSFTGATEDRLGYFRTAHNGTLLLDEISELELMLQPKLLRVLQEDKVLPVGEDKEYKVDVRIIAASNRPLAEQVTSNKFRLDLYQRLNVIRLHIPPLRERLEDIPLLVQYFLKKYKHYYASPIRSVDPSVYAVLRRAVGQGNVRELENIIRQSLVFKTEGSIFNVSDLPEFVRNLASSRKESSQTIPLELAEIISRKLSDGTLDFEMLIDNVEHQILETAIRKLGLKGTQLADRLNLNRRTLYNKLRKHNISITSHACST